MSGQPPVTPPTLSYKSKAQREKEERERREREEAERLAQEQYEARMREARAREEAQRARALQAPPRAQPQVPAPAPAPQAPPAPGPATAPVSPPPAAAGEPAADVVPRISDEDPRSLVMFEEDGLAPGRREIDDIQMLGGAEEEETEEVEEEVEELASGPERHPPRPPKSPDMRPVHSGFLLVIAGCLEFAWGVAAMVGSPHAASGPWSPMVRWGAFSLGFTTAFLGLVAIRGGLWSFRKERFSVVKAGAIAGTVCVWAWWAPWVLGALALVLVTRARDEYYPFYDPRWDAPEYARPPPKAEEPEEDEGEGDEDADGSGEGVRDAAARDYLDDVSPPDDKEAIGLQDAETSAGDGWEDLD